MAAVARAAHDLGHAAASPSRRVLTPSSDDQRVQATLSRNQWQIAQEALDACCYEVEHSKAGGVRPTLRKRHEDCRSELLETLPLLDIVIAGQTGSGLLLGQ